MIDPKLWLPRAMRLPLHGRDRIFHLREGRPNLVIGHDPDKYWCYCQRCKKGGVSEKKHVRLGGAAPPQSESLELPRDMQSIAEPGIGALVEEYLISKCMDLMYIQPHAEYIGYSHSRKRIVLQIHGRWLGRDVTGQAMTKWLSYSNAKYLPSSRGDGVAIVVEDTLSYCKVQWAMPGTAVYCALGTRVHKTLQVQLLCARHKEIVFMFDGDSAGRDGAAYAMRQCRPYLPSRAACAPEGMDPKDMSIEQIQQHLLKYGA